MKPGVDKTFDGVAGRNVHPAIDSQVAGGDTKSNKNPSVRRSQRRHRSNANDPTQSQHKEEADQNHVTKAKNPNMPTSVIREYSA